MWKPKPAALSKGNNHTYTNSVAVKKSFFVSGEFLLRYRARSASTPPSTTLLGWIVLTEWSIVGRYGINRLDINRLVPGHKSDLLAASLPPCATYKDEGCQIASAIGGKAPSARGHACLCGREVITQNKGIKTWWVWGCSPYMQYFQTKHEWSAFSWSGSPRLSLQLLQHLL